MKKLILAVQILTMVFCVSSYAGEKVVEHLHSCDDVKEWAEWKETLEEFPEDDALLSLYAMRLGICEGIKEGTIDPQRGINIFGRYTMMVKAGR